VLLAPQKFARQIVGVVDDSELKSAKVSNVGIMWLIRFNLI
jgi:hypothetical protein